jgi:multicomponent Na+:H+ antiporter subunit C
VEVPLALVVGAIVAGGLYLVLQRNLLRFVFGLILLSGGVNLLLFTAGRPTRGAPPLVPEGAYAPVGAVANAVPQALILTAIVIGFGLTSFALVLLLRAYERLGTLTTDEMTAHLADPRPIAGADDDDEEATP